MARSNSEGNSRTQGHGDLDCRRQAEKCAFGRFEIGAQDKDRRKFGSNEIQGSASGERIHTAQRGQLQSHPIQYNKLFAPVALLETIRAILAITATSDWEVDCIDVVQAYLNSNLHHDIYMKPPKGANVPAVKVYKLQKGLYGLKQSGREWNLELDKFLRTIQFLKLECAPCVYVRGQGDTITVITTYCTSMTF